MTLVTIKISRPHLSKKQIVTILVPPALLIATTIVIFFGKGYVVNLNGRTVEKTGMLVVKSQPDGAKIFIDGEWKSASPYTFSNLRPKSYLLRVEKEGFSTWEKQVNVYPELVTDMTAVLVSMTPKLEPLTIGGASHPTYNETTRTIAYTTTQNKPGIWILPIGRPLPITLFQATPTLVMPDNEKTKYSGAEELTWSPTGDELLVKIKSNDYRLINVSQSQELEKLTTPTKTVAAWEAEKIKKRLAFLEKQVITPELAQTATASATVWSVDDRKFMYVGRSNNTPALLIHNMERPIPIDEKTDYATIQPYNNLTVPIWYPDSYHLILREGNSLYLMRIDGTNKTEIYSGAMEGDALFVAPDGTKVIISASFKKDAPPELYAVSLR